MDAGLSPHGWMNNEILRLDSVIELVRDADFLLSAVTRQWEIPEPKVDFHEVGNVINRMKHLGVRISSADPVRWQGLFIGGTSRDVAYVARDLLAEVFRWVKEILPCDIVPPEDYYHDFVYNSYPLPKPEGFLPGF